VKKYQYCFIFITGLLLFSRCQSSTEYVIGYYPAWNRDAFPAERLDLGRLTHVMHAFAWPLADGSLAYDNDLLYPQLNERVHVEGRKILLSFGGWGNCDGFSPMAADPAARQRFVQGTLNFILAHQYDGVDLDWEFPATVQDRENLVLLVKELREEFDKLMRPQALFTTLAVPTGDYSGQWFDYQKLAPYVDFFGCMTYDFHGGWSNHAGHNSPLYASGGDTDGSVSSSIDYMTKTRHLSSEKVVLGVPFYGREFNASRLYGPSTGGDIDYDYKDIVVLRRQGWSYHWDNTAKVPYLTNLAGNKLITYDDTVSVRLKAEYAVAQNLRGVMIWALGQDDIDGEQPLLKAVAMPILRPTAVKSEKTPIEFSLTSFPNPFNQSTTLSFSLKFSQQISIDLYDCYGRHVRSLISATLPAGENHVSIDGSDLASGLYFCELTLATNRQFCKVTLIK
jgi:chitinase